MENPLPSPQNALTLDEYESLTSARAEFVDFLLGASVEAAEDDGGASEHGSGAKSAGHDGGASERGPGANSAGHDGGKAVAEPRQAGAE